MWRQRARSLTCPDEPRLDGWRVLITGGSEGIGLGTCRGLLSRGARVFMASRSRDKGERACGQLRQEFGSDAEVSFLPIDLSDLERVREAVSTLSGELGEEHLDAVICNAGLWPRRHRLSPQGHELAFATNVLGHHLLLRLLTGGSLAPDARIVIVTGDIYVLANDCTTAYDYRTAFGGMLAYCRSKLGNLWLAGELQRRVPALHVRVVHPGVVATNIGGARTGLADSIGRALLLDSERGCQATLYALTQSGLDNGVYLHNVLGIMQLDPADLASDGARAAALWERCEALCG
jgi:NAD(P)-dependent dehydrogenase (short-subunit alcohol dehydrogenase family)